MNGKVEGACKDCVYWNRQAGIKGSCGHAKRKQIIRFYFDTCTLFELKK